MKIISLKASHEFKYLNDNGIKFVNRNFVIVICNYNNILIEDAELSSLYLGFKITTKTFNAVKRNKLRRQTKHIFRSFSNSDLLKYLNNKCILFVARYGIVNIDYVTLNSEIYKAINYFKNKEQNLC